MSAADDRLVGDVEGVAGERGVQVLLEAVADTVSARLPQVDDLVGGATLALCLIHRGVRVDHQLVGDRLTGTGVGHPDAGGDGELGVPFKLAHTELTVTASVGMAYAGPGEAVSNQLVVDADIAMYQAKRKGGACLLYTSP